MNIRLLLLSIFVVSITHTIASMEQKPNSARFLNAVELGDKETVAKEIALGVDILAKDRFNLNALFLAAMKGHSECLIIVMNEIIKQYPKTAYEIINMKNSNDQWTVLRYAEYFNHPSCITLLKNNLKYLSQTSEKNL